MSKESIEGYLLVLGKLAVVIKLFADGQQHFTQSGVLDDDEIELALSIRWGCDKVIVMISDQIARVARRTAKPWDETVKEIRECLAKEVK